MPDPEIRMSLGVAEIERAIARLFDAYPLDPPKTQHHAAIKAVIDGYHTLLAEQESWHRETQRVVMSCPGCTANRANGLSENETWFRHIWAHGHERLPTP